MIENEQLDNTKTTLKEKRIIKKIKTVLLYKTIAVFRCLLLQNRDRNEAMLWEEKKEEEEKNRRFRIQRENQDKGNNNKGLLRYSICTKILKRDKNKELPK